MTPKEIVNKMFENDPYSKWLGITINSVEAGSCSLSMIIRKEMLNGFGIAHGGITFSLADSALAFASNSTGKQAVSIDTSMNHTEKLFEGDSITAIAKQEVLKNKFGFYTVEIKKGNQVVALFKGTVFRSENDWSL